MGKVVNGMYLDYLLFNAIPFYCFSIFAPFCLFGGAELGGGGGGGASTCWGGLWLYFKANDDVTHVSDVTKQFFFLYSMIFNTDQGIHAC